jgi:hypothetical protein
MKNRILLLLILLSIYQNLGTACSCIGTRSVKEEFNKSDVVFTGKVISKSKFIVADTSLPKGYKMYRTEVKILKIELYKGNIEQDTIYVITGVGGGD